MGYETCTCADCGRREAMDLSREVRFAGEYGPLCDDCLPLALRVAEANAANAAPALRALAARADAAERGMVALGALVDELRAAFKREMSSIHKTPFTGIGHTVELARATEALAAWRALGEVQP